MIAGSLKQQGLASSESGKMVLYSCFDASKCGTFCQLRTVASMRPYGETTFLSFYGDRNVPAPYFLGEHLGGDGFPEGVDFSDALSRLVGLVKPVVGVADIAFDQMEQGMNP